MNIEIRALFDRIAPVYDQLNDWLSLGQHRVWKEMAVKWSNAQLGDIGLDLCCGSGDLTFRLARHVGREGKIYGVDFSTNLLASAQKKAEKHYPQPSITWIEADVLNLPFADNQFDVVTMGYGLRNVQDIPLCLQEIYRVLKPGAKAAILDFHQPSNELVRLLQKWYLDNLVVPLATNLGLKEEYAYIRPSLDRFPTGSKQIDLAQQAGFYSVKHYPIANGMMGVLIVSK